MKYELHISYLEIYNDVVTDLLDSSSSSAPMYTPGDTLS